MTPFWMLALAFAAGFIAFPVAVVGILMLVPDVPDSEWDEHHERWRR